MRALLWFVISIQFQTLRAVEDHEALSGLYVVLAVVALIIAIKEARRPSGVSTVPGRNSGVSGGPPRNPGGYYSSKPVSEARPPPPGPAPGVPPQNPPNPNITRPERRA